jgi:hypothetical protein
VEKDRDGVDSVGGSVFALVLVKLIPGSDDVRGEDLIMAILR